MRLALVVFSGEWVMHTRWRTVCCSEPLSSCSTVSTCPCGAAARRGARAHRPPQAPASCLSAADERHRVRKPRPNGWLCAPPCRAGGDAAVGMPVWNAGVTAGCGGYEISSEMKFPKKSDFTKLTNYSAEQPARFRREQHAQQRRSRGQFIPKPRIIRDFSKGAESRGG